MFRAFRMTTTAAATALATAMMVWAQSVPAAAADDTAPSTLVISTDGPKLRVTIDGKAYGKFTTKSLTIPSVGPGKHDVKVDWVDAQLRKKTVYDGKLSVSPGVEMRIRAAAEGIQVTDQVAIAAKVAPTPVGAPVKDFANAPSILHISSEKFMTMVVIDGTPLQQGDCKSPKACDVIDIAPGNHDIEVKGGAFGTKPIFKGIVQITGGAEVFAKAADNEFKIYNTQQRPQEATTTTVIVNQPVAQPVVVAGGTTTSSTTTTTVSGGGVPMGGVGIGMQFVDPATGEMVSMNVSAGAMGGTATVGQTTTTTTVSGSGTTGGVIVAQPGPATSTVVTSGNGPGTIEFTSEDGESFQVFIDGKKVGQFMGLDGQSVTVKNVKAGEHKLVIKDFMGNEIWATGRLYMDPGFQLKMGVGEKSGLEAFNRPNAWESAH